MRHIEQYVSSRIRARREFTQFGSALGEQLPAWLVSAKNRDAVLRAIVRMRESLDTRAFPPHSPDAAAALPSNTARE